MSYKHLKISILYADFGPYHVARIEALNNALVNQKCILHAYQFAKVSDIYAWEPAYPAQLPVTTFCKNQPATILKSLKLAYYFYKVLKKHEIEVIFLPSYSPLPYLLCLLVSKLCNCKTILMCDSWDHTEKQGKIRRKIKGIIIKMFDAALVAGAPHIRYITKYGISPQKVFLASNVVDVKYFHSEAIKWKNLTQPSHPHPGLPKKYFLNLGRFVKKKNLGFLIESYALYVSEHPSTEIALVLVGEGPEKDKLRTLATNLGISIREGLESSNPSIPKAEIVFFPFQQIDTTPLFFTYCEAFILPSLQEEWGLVINEAMSCEAPVVVSSHVGCVEDLVIDSKTGFIFDPQKKKELANIMQKFAVDTTLSAKIGKEAFSHIQQWTPERFAQGALEAIQATSQL
ncbi:glycosyltransferase family 4 protein [Runella sp. MFBS21]|uniref:glycosyltransferase family 4 protein n=1 Tax=Runella sp. MFBS21 TaxID=3034018 RepID=UPI0023F75524|nr:glycosyltransferase family 4 protein [Runella sp. MFBS21]MDF7822101.1 glycosyltransferase family 4 protein [Runella sp. MFBS21]